MRNLILMRGIPGSGKSTWLETNNLTPYVLSPDNFRMQVSGLVMNDEGNLVIDQSASGKAWKMTFDNLELKMSKGEFVIVDATHLVNKGLSNYKKLADTYRYRVYMIDFTDISLEELYARDLLRNGYKQVGTSVINFMNDNKLKQDVAGIPSWITVIKPEEFDNSFKNYYVDLNSYENILTIGDIHGCYDVLMEMIDGYLKDDTMYIFTGDFFERGIQNLEVLEWLLKVYTKKNVVMLEGNHELYAWQYANDEPIKCREFSNVVAPIFDNSNVDKKEIRRFYRKLRKNYLFEYGDKRFVITHGGLTAVSDKLALLPEIQCIRGVGSYETDVDYLFSKNVKNYENENNDNYTYYQIHGHRNSFYKPILDLVDDRSFNLEGNVEGGLFLRGLLVNKEGIKGISVKNNTYDKKYKPKEISPETTVEELINILRHDTSLIKESKNGNISSFNFTPKAFYDDIWNNQTTKARGIHIDINKNKILARGYDKFFSLREYDDIN